MDSINRKTKHVVETGDIVLVINRTTSLPTLTRAVYSHPENKWFIVKSPKGYSEGYSTYCIEYIGLLIDRGSVLTSNGLIDIHTVLGENADRIVDDFFQNLA